MEEQFFLNTQRHRCIAGRMAVPPSHFPAVETWIPGVKPTSLLYANNCIPQVPDEMALPTAVRPTSALIGRDFNGHVKTAVAKEYPGQSL